MSEQETEQNISGDVFDNASGPESSGGFPGGLDDISDEAFGEIDLSELGEGPELKTPAEQMFGEPLGDLVGESAPEKKEVQADEQEQEPEKEKSAADPVESQEKTKPAKTVEVVVDGKTISLDRDEIKIPTLVNGEVKEVLLKDLQSDYSGRTETARRFTELDNERKALDAHRKDFDARSTEFRQKESDFNAKIKLLNAAAAKGDYETVLMTALEMDPNSDPVTFWDEFHAKMGDYFAGYNALSREQKEALALKRRNALLSSQNEKRSTELDKRRAEQEYAHGKRTVLSSLNLQESDVESAWDQMQRDYANGKITPEEAEQIKQMNALDRYGYVANYAVGLRVRAQMVEMAKAETGSSDTARLEQVIQGAAQKIGLGKVFQATESELREAIKATVGNQTQSDSDDNEGQSQPEKVASGTSSLSGKITPRQKPPTSNDTSFDSGGLSITEDDIWAESGLIIK